MMQGHDEISSNPYGILKGVKDGAAFTQDTWGAALCNEMTPQSGDLIVKGKSGLCGFASTNLDFLLRQHSIQNVVLGGFLTNCCVSINNQEIEQCRYDSKLMHVIVLYLQLSHQCWLTGASSVSFFVSHHLYLHSWPVLLIDWFL
jgi:Isochorismatase family